MATITKRIERITATMVLRRAPLPVDFARNEVWLFHTKHRINPTKGMRDPTFALAYAGTGVGCGGGGGTGIAFSSEARRAATVVERAGPPSASSQSRRSGHALG